MKRLLFSVLLVTTMLGQITAQIITDRPDQTESSSTVGRGNLQVESGLLVGYEENGLFTTRQLLFPTTLFRYGLLPRLEIRVLSQLENKKFMSNSVQGVSDIEIGLKIQILKEHKNTEIAFLTHLAVPTGTKDLTAEKYGTVNKLAILHRLNENIGLGYNLGYSYFGEQNGDLTYSMSLGIGVNEKVGVYIEPFGSVTNLKEFVLNFDAGFTYLASDNLQFDFSFGTGVNKKMNYMSIGCTWLINKRKE